MPSASARPSHRLSDLELLDSIKRDLRAIYTDVIRQPLPEPLAAALQRLEARSNIAPVKSPTQSEQPVV